MKTRSETKTVVKHYHITNTPIVTKHRYAARTLRRKLERDQLKGKLPAAMLTVQFAVMECVGKCVDMMVAEAQVVGKPSLGEDTTHDRQEDSTAAVCESAPTSPDNGGSEGLGGVGSAS